MFCSYKGLSVLRGDHLSWNYKGCQCFCKARMKNSISGCCSCKGLLVLVKYCHCLLSSPSQCTPSTIPTSPNTEVVQTLYLLVTQGVLNSLTNLTAYLERKDACSKSVGALSLESDESFSDEDQCYRKRTWSKYRQEVLREFGYDEIQDLDSD